MSAIVAVLVSAPAPGAVSDAPVADFKAWDVRERPGFSFQLIGMAGVCAGNFPASTRVHRRKKLRAKNTACNRPRLGARSPPTHPAGHQGCTARLVPNQK